MTNPLFLMVIWWMAFLFETLLPWSFLGWGFYPWLSRFVLGHVLYELPIDKSLPFAAFVFVIESSYSLSPFPVFANVGGLFFLILFMRRYSLWQGAMGRTWVVALACMLSLPVHQMIQGSFFSDFFSRPRSFYLLGLLGFSLNLVLGGFLFWLLKEKGGWLEDKLFSNRSRQQTQMNLFDLRSLRRSSRRSTRVQKRIRHRFGLKDSW